MVRARKSQYGKINNSHKILIVDVKGRENFGDLDVDGRKLTK
jgi:uncharacterized protein YkvS